MEGVRVELENADDAGEYVSLRLGDQIGTELIRIGIIQPGQNFVEKPVRLKKARFYRPCAMFTLFFWVMIIAMSTYLYGKHTGKLQVLCEHLPPGQLLAVSWVIIIIAVVIGVIGAYIIYAVPTMSCLMNRLLTVLPMEQCVLSDNEKETILPGCSENEMLKVRLAGSAGDGFGCFFGQNGNIGISRLSDYCQDLDINVVYTPQAEDEYTFKTTGIGLMSVTINKLCPLSNFKISDDIRLVSGTKVLAKLNEELPKQMGAAKSSVTPPAVRIEKSATVNDQMIPVQYDYVFSLLSQQWPPECMHLLEKYEFLADVPIYVVPKPWKVDEASKNDMVWRYSFTEAERALFKHFQTHHKMLLKCYIILKFIIKFEKVTPFPEVKCISGVDRDSESERSLRSFYLKTIFFHIAEELEDRRLASLNSATEEGNQNNENDEDYRFTGSLEELFATISHKISPDELSAEENFSFVAEENLPPPNTTPDEDLTTSFSERPIRYANRFFSAANSFMDRRLRWRSKPKVVERLTNDDLFCLILNLYINAVAFSAIYQLLSSFRDIAPGSIIFSAFKRKYMEQRKVSYTTGCYQIIKVDFE